MPLFVAFQPLKILRNFEENLRKISTLNCHFYGHFREFLAKSLVHYPRVLQSHFAKNLPVDSLPNLPRYSLRNLLGPGDYLRSPPVQYLTKSVAFLMSNNIVDFASNLPAQGYIEVCKEYVSERVPFVIR